MKHLVDYANTIVNEGNSKNIVRKLHDAIEINCIIVMFEFINLAKTSTKQLMIRVNNF